MNMKWIKNKYLKKIYIKYRKRKKMAEVKKKKKKSCEIIWVGKYLW
jgi:hypothetical protein